MINTGACPRLAAQPLGGGGIGISRANHLQSNGAVQAVVPRGVHDAHAALSERPRNLVMADRLHTLVEFCCRLDLNSVGPAHRFPRGIAENIIRGPTPCAPCGPGVLLSPLRNSRAVQDARYRAVLSDVLAFSRPDRKLARCVAALHVRARSDRHFSMCPDVLLQDFPIEALNICRSFLSGGAATASCVSGCGDQGTG
jgi:hypothetical protein